MSENKLQHPVRMLCNEQVQAQRAEERQQCQQCPYDEGILSVPLLPSDVTQVTEV